jgi:hypothetical protein
MKKSKRIRGVKRSVLLATLLVGMAGGSAYAVLQSQQDTLSSNTISTASANLTLSLDNIVYADSRPGYNFTNIIPGGAAVPTTGNPVYLKNNGGTPLGIKFMVSNTPTGTAGIDLSKVDVLLTTVASGNPVQTFTLQSLMSSFATGGITVTGSNIDPGNFQQYKLQVSMTSDAMSASSASIGNIDFAFRGFAQ